MKDSLSRYLRMVKEGERIVITDHNRVVAEIIPASATDEDAKLLHAYLDEHAKSGGLTPATKRTTLDPEPTSIAQIDKEQIERVYDETRQDRK